MKHLSAILLAALVAAAPAPAAAQEKPDFAKVLSLVDSRSSFPDADFSAVVRLVSEDPERGRSEDKVALFRRDSMDAFLMLALESANKKGQGTLLVEDNLWFYDPTSRKFTHTSLKDNYGESAAKNSDFRSSSKAEDYEVASYAEATLGKYECWVVDLKARRDDVTYPFMRLWVSKGEYLQLKAEEYSLGKRLLRTSLYPSYAKIGNKYVATRAIFQDALVAGKRTELLMGEISVKPLSDEMFTKGYLEKVGR